MKKILTLLLCLTFIAGSAHASRIPSKQRAESVILHYFHKYAKKYPTTSFGQYKVTKVEVENQQEIKKDKVAVEAYLTLGNGDLKKINATLERKNIAWKFISWENPDGH